MTGQNAFRFRPFVSLLTAFTFVMIVVTAAVLYITPPGRVANWTGWTFWGLSKHQWIALHICFGTTFVICSILHIWLNLKPLLSYFVNNAAASKTLRFEWIATIALCVIVFWGALKPFVPFSSLLDLNERIKFSWEKPKEQAPVPHAELLTLLELSNKTGLEADQMQLNLRMKGIEAGWEDIIGDLAEQHHLSPNELFAIATGKKPVADSKNHGGGGGGGGGFGQKTLKDACAEMNLDVQQAIETLKAAGIEATADQTIRQIADKNGLHPSEIRQYLK